MKKYLPIILSFSFLWMSISCKKTDDNKYEIVRSSKYKEIIRESRKEIGLRMNLSGIPGMSVAVYLKNKLIWSEGLGYANKELKVPVQPDTKFRIGGVSKMFTGALLATLVDEGELDLKTPIRQYYPELPADKDSLTLYTLASQTSGLRQPTGKEMHGSIKGFKSIRKGISVFIKDSLLFNPGQYFFETDYAYDLIGATIERKTEQKFHKVLQEKLTDTLGLECTIEDDPVRIIDKRSQCYDLNFIAQCMRAVTLNNKDRAASVGLLSSAVDIASLMNEYLYPTVLSPEMVKSITEQATLKNGTKTNSGIGLFIGKDTRGRDLYMSTGTTKGGSAAVIAYPKFDLVVACTCNYSNNDSELPVFKIASKFIELFEPKPEKKPEEKKEKKKDLKNEKKEIKKEKAKE